MTKNNENLRNRVASTETSVASASKRSRKTGLLPGTLIHIGEQKVEKATITVIDYDESQYQEKQTGDIEECRAFRDQPTTTWITVTGLHNTEFIEKIGQCFNLHPLLLEDVLNTEQRPKFDDYENYLFLVLKMISYDDKRKEIKVEQISLVLGANYVISFQEQEMSILEEIRSRIKNNKGRIRKMGADYLAYSMIDIIIDNYFTVLEKLGETIDDLEEKLVGNTKPQTLQILHRLKWEMMLLRKSVWPLRELIGTLERGEFELIRKTTCVYLRDVYDHTIQVIETVDTFRDMLSGMVDIYLSSINNKTNEIMKVLTMIATIFIPLTFIVGVYGMNFEFMPELKLKWAYPALLLLMGVIAVFMVIYFRKKKWL
jgi:magnesium transporter